MISDVIKENTITIAERVMHEGETNRYIFARSAPSTKKLDNISPTRPAPNASGQAVRL